MPCSCCSPAARGAGRPARGRHLLTVEAKSSYLNSRLDEFLEEVATAAPLPGAAYVAAVGVAMAAGLVAMTARLSIEHWPEAAAVAAQAETLRERVTPLAEMNAEAYASAISALPKSLTQR